MNRTLQRALRVVALTAAITAAAPLAATAALADTGVDVPSVDVSTDTDVPQTNVIGDTTIEGLDLVQDAATGCAATPVIDPDPPFAYEQVPPPAGSSSIYYRESSQATFTVGGSCRAGVKVQVCLTDGSIPTWRVYRRCRGSEATGRTVTAKVEQDVPYVGPDAGIVRPYGDINVTILAWNKRSDGRYPTTPTRCMSFHLAFEPAVGAFTLEQRVDCPSVLATDAVLASLAT